MADGKVTRAELAEAIRGLREEVAALRAGRAAHQCPPCTHIHWHSLPVPGCAPVYPNVWYPSAWSAGVAAPVTINSGALAAGAAPAGTVLSISI